MYVVLADPSAFSPAYDHELAAALGRAGVDVELVTSRFRFGDAPVPSGYRRSEPFYPLSSRLFRRSRLRLPLKVVEHLREPQHYCGAGRTCCTCNGSQRRSSTAFYCGLALLLSSRRTISCRGGRRGNELSGNDCWRGSIVSSYTASEGARRLPSSASTRGSSLTQSFRASPNERTTAERCSRSESSVRTKGSAMQSQR